MVELSETVEMATLDKEMAEERAENLQLELVNIFVIDLQSIRGFFRSPLYLVSNIRFLDPMIIMHHGHECQT